MKPALLVAALLALPLPLLLPSPARAAPAATAAEATVFAHPADAAAVRRALGALTGPLAQAQRVEGRYTQAKYLRELPQPLRAEGEFMFVRELGVAWRTLKPFASELLITRDALIQRDGGSSQRIGAERTPAVRQVARIFFAVFSLDFEELSELFALSLQQGQDGQWQLGLKPRQDAGLISAIIVSGAREVQRVQLFEAGGDRTEIEFRDTRVSNAAVDAATRARFQ